MITIDDVRTAVGSSDPGGTLDGLVRNELAAGKTAAEIYAALLPITRAVRKASPLPEDVDEILLGTLDALTGHCDPDYCYKDPPAAPANGAVPHTPADGRQAEARPPA